jgi:hypothetical protein
VTLRDVVSGLDELDPEETIYAESASPDARAVVVPEPADGPPEGLRYLLEVGLAQESIRVWRDWRPGKEPTLEDKLEAILHYVENDAWLPL